MSEKISNLKNLDFQGSSSNSLFAKGAPENILSRCSTFMMPDGSVEKLTPSMKKTISEEIDDFAGDALRTLALAVKEDLPSPFAEYDGTAKHKAHKQITPEVQI